MAEKKWIAKAIKHPGSFRKMAGVKKGQEIPLEFIDRMSKKKGIIGKRARLAKTLRSFN